MSLTRFLGFADRTACDAHDDTSVRVVLSVQSANPKNRVKSTTLASVICHDLEIQAAFSDGILWIELGEHPPGPLKVLNEMLHVLEPSGGEALTLDDARQRWQNALEKLAYLLVVDDVWQTEALKELLQGGPRCGRLITTRNDQLLPEGAKRVWVDAMEPEEAMALLCQGLIEDWQHTLDRSVLKHVVVQQLGCWPLLVSLARGMLKNQMRLNKKSEQALAQVNKPTKAGVWQPFIWETGSHANAQWMPVSR
jgi:NB-ARC domain